MSIAARYRIFKLYRNCGWGFVSALRRAWRKV